MTSDFRIDVDNSFTDICLNLIKRGKNETFANLLSHPAAKKIHAHAMRFGNTTSSIEEFWSQIVTDSFNNETAERIESTIAFLEERKHQLASSLDEVSEYLPEDLEFDCTLYTMVGYDIGIVSDGAALLNVAHPYFRMNPCELIFMAMHEVHHVGFVHYNPIFSLSDLVRLSDLRNAVRYSTHLEGIAVYTPLQRRMKSRCIFHEDYSALLNEEIAEQRRTQYFELVKSLESESDRIVEEIDFDIFEPMSATGKRLWYVTGAYMAKKIDEKLGRESLLETIRLGSDRFFELYESVS